MTDHKPSDELLSPPQPQLCVGGCGFFGNSATANMCSVCYKQHANSAKQSSAEAQSPAAPKVETVTAAQVAVPSPSQPKPAAEAVAAPPAMVAESTSAATAAAPDETTGMDMDDAGAGEGACAPVEQTNHNRCFSCNKRVGFTGFKCRCEYTFCSTHRHSNKHNCTFDYKALGRDAVAKANPAVIKDRVDSRI